MTNKLVKYLYHLEALITHLPENEVLKKDKQWQTFLALINREDVFSLVRYAAPCRQIQSCLTQIITLNTHLHEDYLLVYRLTNKVLIELAKAFPRNEMTNSRYPTWICPITLKEAHECEAQIVLTSGYLYDREGLLTWFRRAKVFTDPITRQPLSSFDKERMIKLENGLSTIEELESIYKKKLNELLTAQYEFLDQSSDTISDAIKKLFYSMTMWASVSTEDDNYKEATTKLLDFIRQAQIAQLPSIYNTNNFSNLNLSGLYFYKNKFNHLDLRGANLSGCVFLGDTITNRCMHADLSGANLENVQFLNLPGRGICIKSTNFTHANLRHANLTGICNWGEVNVDRADLSEAFLYNKKGIQLKNEALKKYLKARHVQGLTTAIFASSSEGPSTSAASTSAANTSAASTSAASTSAASTSAASTSGTMNALPASSPRLSVMPRGRLFDQPLSSVSVITPHENREERRSEGCCILS